MANWNKLNEEFNRVLDNLSDIDWDIWANNRKKRHVFRETPVLYGKDAERFTKAMENPEPIDSKVSARMKANYEAIMKIAKF